MLTQAIRNRPEHFERVLQSMIRSVHGHNESGEGYFQYSLWFVAWYRIRCQQLLFWNAVL